MKRKNARADIQQHPERAVPDEAAAILAEGLVAHVGLSIDGQPYVIPMNYAFDVADPKRIYLHGARGSRVIEYLEAGLPACVAVTLLDGLVYSRDARFHSVNYRSVVAFGKGHPVQDLDEKAIVFERMIARHHPGREVGRDYAPPASADLMATAIVCIEIEEMSSKARRGGPKGPHDADPSSSGTCGVVEV